MRLLIIALAIFGTQAQATEIRLDDAWLNKLGALCQAAQYGSRMIAEPICVELQQKFAAAKQEDSKNLPPAIPAPLVQDKK